MNTFFEIAQAFIADLPDIVSAVLITLATSGLLWLFRAKVKIIYGSTNWSLHQLNLPGDQPPGLVSSEKIYVQNVGRKSANSIELVFSRKPVSYKVWAPREHTERILPDGEYSITIPSLAPRELLIVDILSTGTRAELLSVNSPDCISKRVPFQPQRLFGNFMMLTVGYLMLAGFVGTVFLILKIF